LQRVEDGFEAMVKVSHLVAPALLPLLFATGCHGSSASASSHPLEPAAAAPFASAPVLTGTPDVATLVARVKPSVVNITAIHEARPREEISGRDGLGDLRRFFDPWNRMAPGGPGGGEEGMQAQALGSGFLVDAQGHVVTNAHVIADAKVVKVKLADEREFRAKVVGTDERLDVAVLQLENPPHDLPQASLGSSEALRVGEYVVAIGNPFGLGDTVTMGIVSAKGRTIGAGPYDDFIQTDASINPGNSGGPLFDLRGQVVGINTAINPQGKGIGFAIPVDAIRQVVPQLIAHGRVSRGRIGALIQGMDEDLAKALGMDHPHGALVENVESGSPAEKAGIRSGDAITAVDGHDVAHAGDLPRMIAQHEPGTRVKLTVVHEGRSHDVDVTLDALQKEEHAEATPPPAAQSAERAKALGIAVGDADGHAVVERVNPNGPADGKLRSGDVIEEVNQQAVTSASDLADKVKHAPTDRPVLLRVKRGEQSMFVAVERSTAG
jgi:serine protease Do